MDILSPPALITSRRQIASRLSTANVLDYGADPTGIADSTAAFQAAANTAPYAALNVWSQRGIILYVPAGIYRITSRITLVAGTIVQGATQECVIIIPEHTNDDVFYC